MLRSIPGDLNALRWIGCWLLGACNSPLIFIHRITNIPASGRLKPPSDYAVSQLRPRSGSVAVRNKAGRWLKYSRRLQRAHVQITVSFPTAGGESGVQGHVRHQCAMSHCREKAEHLLLTLSTRTLTRQRRWLLSTGRTVSAGLRTRGAAAPRRLTKPRRGTCAGCRRPRARRGAGMCVLHTPP